MGKTYADSYLYSKYPQYQKSIMDILLNGERLDTNAKDFDDIVYEFKHRQIADYLYKILKSPKVVLLTHTNPLPKPLKVLAAKDPKDKQTYKVFVDVSGLVIKKDGIWHCADIDILIAHLVNAMVCMAYTLQPQLILSQNVQILGMQNFSILFTHVVDYLLKISLDPTVKARVQMMACMFFAENMLGAGYDKLRYAARKITGLSEREENILELYKDEHSFLNIKTFIDYVGKALKKTNLTVDTFIDRWMMLYGTSTPFATEYFPALSTLLTDAYVGCYLNNQKTIEKICDKTYVEYCKEILQKGSSFVK